MYYFELKPGDLIFEDGLIYLIIHVSQSKYKSAAIERQGFQIKYYLAKTGLVGQSFFVDSSVIRKSKVYRQGTLIYERI